MTSAETSHEVQQWDCYFTVTPCAIAADARPNVRKCMPQCLEYCLNISESGIPSNLCNTACLTMCYSARRSVGEYLSELCLL